MPYNIELMCIGENTYPLLERSAAALNGVQNEFRFYLTSVRQPGLAFQRDQYTTTELWAFLREHKQKFGGYRPFIIAFVAVPLKSPKLQNIFASHEATEGLAVVTTFGADQYVKEATRYCCYYMTRYSLSFVNPSIKAHDDADRKNCYFHRKMYKPDIRASMDTGHICDKCMEQLDNPFAADGANRLNDDERDALTRMRKFVSGDLPYAIVMKGGGVKGLAFAGALLEIEKYFWFDRHVGTSAGAIAAVLLAATYTPSELRDILLEKDFCDFMDPPSWRVPLNLALRQGCYPGEALQSWIADLLIKKIPKIAEIGMSALHGALIYASRRGTGTIPFDSNGERKDTVAAFAVRCSMSIPLLFFPMYVDGRRVFDGGLRHNFPLKRFLDDHPRSNFIALYLGKPDGMIRRSIGSELIDIVIEGEERKTVDDNIDHVIIIDTSPIGTIDFRLDNDEKQFLLKVGRAAALRFLYNRKLDDGPNEAEMKAAQAEADASRILVRRVRQRRRARRIAGLLFFIFLVAGPYLFWRFNHGN